MHLFYKQSNKSSWVKRVFFLIKNIYSHDKNEAQSPNSQIPVACLLSWKKKKKDPMGISIFKIQSRSWMQKPSAGLLFPAVFLFVLPFKKLSKLLNCIRVLPCLRQPLSEGPTTSDDLSFRWELPELLTVNHLSPLSARFLPHLFPAWSWVIEASPPWIH